MTAQDRADTAIMVLWQHPVRLVRRWPTLAAVLVGLTACLAMVVTQSNGWGLAAVASLFLAVLIVETVLPQKVVATEKEVVFRAGWSRKRLDWDGLVAVEASHVKWLGFDTVELVGVYADGARVPVPEFRLFPRSRGDVWGGDEVAAVLTGLAASHHRQTGGGGN